MIPSTRNDHRGIQSRGDAKGRGTEKWRTGMTIKGCADSLEGNENILKLIVVGYEQVS